MRILALTLSLVFCVSASAENQSVTVFAHYCNWHHRNTYQYSWTRANTIPTRPDDHKGYDSYDRTILAEQNREMVNYGIVPLVSWWGPGAFAGDPFLDRYLLIPGPKVAILYEVTGRLKTTSPDVPWVDFDDPVNRERFLRDMEHLYTRYWSQGKYADRWFRIDDKPVLFIWLSHAFRGNFVPVAAAVRERIPLYIIGSDFNVGPDFREGLKQVVRGMDAISAYGIYSPVMATLTGGSMSEAYVQRYIESYRAWMDWLRSEAPGVKLIPPVQFAYHDNRGNPVLESTYEEATHLAQTIRYLMEESVCNGDPLLPLINVTSYNEHYEATSIEPTLEYRDDWLRIIDSYLRPPLPEAQACPHDNPVPDPSELVPVTAPRQ